MGNAEPKEVREARRIVREGDAEKLAAWLSHDVEERAKVAAEQASQPEQVEEEGWPEVLLYRGPGQDRPSSIAGPKVKQNGNPRLRRYVPADSTQQTRPCTSNSDPVRTAEPDTEPRYTVEELRAQNANLRACAANVLAAWDSPSPGTEKWDRLRQKFQYLREALNA